MGLGRFLNSIVRMLWLIILLGAIGGGFTAYTSYYSTTPMYRAETTVFAMSKGSSTDGSKSINYQDVMLSRQLVQDYQEILTSEKVLELAVKQLEKYQITQAQLKSMIQASTKNDSSVIAISAEWDDPKIAAEASDAVTQAFIISLNEITNGSIIGILNQAKVPQFPISDNSNKNIIIGTLAGFIVAFAFIYIRELFDTTIRYVEDVEHNMKINVVGIIPTYGIK